MKLPELKIKRMEIEPGRRILAVSDIHGHLSHLQKLLESARFCDDDILFIVGDIVEKGPESLSTLRYVMKLCERGNVIPLIGNVDAWRLHMINGISEDSIAGFYKYTLKLRSWYGTGFFDELTAELGFKCGSPEEVLGAREGVIAHFKEEFDFLANLPAVIETQNYIFVHGGLYDKDVGANRGRGVFDLLKYDCFLNTEICFDKYVVAGHTPVTLYADRYSPCACNPIINREKKIISIDGGCGIKSFGQLNLLIIPDINCGIEDVHFISHDDLPAFRAASAQEESVDHINISWLDSEVIVLEESGDFTKIEHKSTGRVLCVPSSYLYTAKDVTHCSDFTSYVLPVRKSEVLSLVERFPHGCVVKKDGVLGWYFGELREIHTPTFEFAEKIKNKSED